MDGQQERAARATRRDYCRGCSGPTLHPFYGWATPDAHENTIRPRAFYRSCKVCGLVVLVLGGDRDVNDAEGIARSVLDKYLRRLGGAASAISKPVGPPPIDWDAALNYLLETQWLLYTNRWNPAFGDGRGTFRGFAVATLPLRLNSWIRDERGDASGNKGGRVHPKAHSPGVCTSYDQLIEQSGSLEDRDAMGGHPDDYGGLDTLERSRAGDAADDRSPDLARALVPRGR